MIAIWFSNDFAIKGSFYVPMIAFYFLSWQTSIYTAVFYNVCFYNIGQRMQIIASLLRHIRTESKQKGSVAQVALSDT